MEEAKKIYIGNLEFSVNDEDLVGALSEKGLTASSVTVISDNYSGRSKGFGFAEFEEEAQADSAIEALNGFELKGRALRVSKAKKRKPKSDFQGNSGGFNNRSRY